MNNQTSQTSLSLLTVHFLIDGKLVEIPLEDFSTQLEMLRTEQISFSYQDQNGFWKHYEFEPQLSDDEERIREFNSK